MPRLTNRPRPARQARATGLGRAAVLALLVVAMAAAVAALTVRGTQLSSTMPSTRVESYLELLVLAGGALAAAWVGVSALVAGVCVTARSAGRTWSRGERLVARHAPAIVRRAARIGVSVSVGAGLVLGGGAAHAAGPEGADDRPAVAVVDLGWRPSAPSVAPGDTGVIAPSGPAELADPPSPGDGAREPVPPAEGQGAEGDGAGGSAAPDTAEPSEPSAGGAVDDAAPPRDGERAERAADASGGASSASGTLAPDETSGPAGGSVPVPMAAPAPADGVPGSPRSAPRDAPERSPAAERDAALVVTRDAPAPVGEVVVLRGDTLWDIAARTLPADADDATVAAEVERWYAANADTIGADPDLIRPGQVLVAPTA